MNNQPYLAFEDGKYFEFNTTGSVEDLSGFSGGLRIWVTNADCYLKLGSADLGLADCLVPTSSGDACSCFVPSGAWIDLKKGNNTKIAIKAVGEVDSKVWIIPFEVRS
jgi:hypothetical protein